MAQARFSLLLLLSLSVSSCAGNSAQVARHQPLRAVAEAHLSEAELAPKDGDRFPVIAMDKGLIGEEQPGHAGKHGQIHYMTAQEREDHRVVIKGGEVYDHAGSPYQAPDNKLMYVMDKSGNFYLFNQKGHEELRHSSVFDGAPVAAAGEIRIVDSQVTRINRDSGHYSPEQRNFENALRELKADGVEVDHVQVTVKGGV